MLKILARDERFIVGLHRRRMKAISYLGRLDQIFGEPATTRSWNTMNAIARALDRG